MDDVLREELKSALRADGQRYHGSYAKWPDEVVRAFIGNVRARREKREALDAMIEAKRREPEPEDDGVVGGDAGTGTLQHGCGGGQRVIRSVRGLS